MRILLAHRSSLLGHSFTDDALVALRHVGEVVLNDSDTTLNGQALIDRAQGCDAIVTDWWTPGTAELFERVPSLQVFSRAAEKLDNIDLAAATANGILVANVPEAYMDALTHLVIGQAIALRVWSDRALHLAGVPRRRLHSRGRDGAFEGLALHLAPAGG